jgi:hypothetical protein
MTQLRKFAACLPLALGALAAAGCGAQNLNTAKLEREIKTGIESQSGVRVSSVKCPSPVKIQQGNVFNCTATTAGGQRATVRVTQRDSKGGIYYRVG